MSKFLVRCKVFEETGNDTTLFLINKESFEYDFTINLELNGGTCAVDSITVTAGKEIGFVASPTKGDLVLEGWYYDQSFTKKMYRTDKADARYDRLYANYIMLDHDYGADIPIPYTKLSYVESTGDKLNTGIAVNSHLIVGLKWCYPAHTLNGKMFFGNYNTVAYSSMPVSRNYAMRSSWSSQPYSIYHGFKASDSDYGTEGSIPNSNCQDSNIHTVVFDEEKVTYDGNEHNYYDVVDDLAATDGMDAITSKMYLFGDDSSNRNAIFQCYNFYLRDAVSDTTLLNLIPCVDGEGTAALYDTVGKKLMYASLKAGPYA